MLFTPSENSYRFYLHEFLLFILLIANSGNYLHLSIVVHYKIVRTNNVLSVNIVLIKIRLLKGCHLIGTIKHSIHLYPNPTLYEIWKGRKSLAKGRFELGSITSRSTSHTIYTTETLHLCAVLTIPITRWWVELIECK